MQYDSLDAGFTLLRLTDDTVSLHGLHVLDLLRGKGAFMKSLEMHEPKIYVTEIPEWHGGGKKDAVQFMLPDKLPVIAFDSIIITDMLLSLPDKYLPSGQDSFIRGASAHLAGFHLDSAAIVAEPLLYSKHADLEIPKLRFDVEEGVYEVDAGPIHASLIDSLITIDTVSFTSNYSEEDFSVREKYPRGKMNIHCTDIQVQGFDLEKFMQRKHLVLHKCTASTWSVDYYCDKRKPPNPHPSPAIMPNDVAREFHLPVNIDSLILDNGRIRIRERAPESIQTGLITFDHVRIDAYPYSTDSSCGNCGKATTISVSALFLGEAPITALASCELQHPGLDLEIEASVGKFSAKRLNSFLIPNERKEVTDGTIESGNLKMNIHNGIARTTVTPHYKDLSMKILPKEAGATRGLLEGIKTFVANTFVLRSNNIGPSAISGTTTYRRQNSEEFLQFIWIALRKSLGKVIGGFN